MSKSFTIFFTYIEFLTAREIKEQKEMDDEDSNSSSSGGLINCSLHFKVFKFTFCSLSSMSIYNTPMLLVFEYGKALHRVSLLELRFASA